MLVLVGPDESFSLQINITKDITSIIQWVKDFSMIPFPCILLFHGILIAFSISVFNCKYSACNCTFGLGNGGQRAACGVCSRLVVLYMYVYMCMCECMYVCMYVYI